MAIGRERLTFSQAQGYEELPRPLRLEELPEEARTRIWNLIFTDLQRTRKEWKAYLGGPYVGGEWATILKSAHTEFHKLPLDEWDQLFDANRARLRNYIGMAPFNKVFDLIEFIMRHPDCKRKFVKDMERTFSACQLAYVIEVGQPPTVLPAATPREGRAIVDAIRTLDEAGLHGSTVHLRRASECLNAGAWADSVRESINAVESVARRLAPRAKSLERALSALQKRGGRLHPALDGACKRLYGYTSDEQGIRHPLLDQSAANVGQDEAVFMLGACASFSSYLQRKYGSGEAL